MADTEKLKSLAYRMKDLSSLRSLFAELNYDFVDEPVNKQDWSEDEKNIVTESRIIAKKDDYLIYYIQTNTDSLKEWKGIASKIIKHRHGLCLVCSHNPSGFKWVFSSISREFTKSFSETRHIPVEIRPESGVPKSFVEFLEKIEADNYNASTIAAKISEAFDNFAVQIHDELTINVFEALKTLSEGIILEESNKLELSNEMLEKIREPIFILLYRIMFVLYAEDRGIFLVENKIYHEKFSLKWIKHEWLLKPDLQKNLREYEVEERLRNLFRLIELGSEDFGYKSEEFFMRSYYGRLFDRKIHHELEKWKIPNKQMLEAISLLTRTRDKKGNYFFLDYAALETRHLGSVYEHLLEYHLAVKGKKIADLPDPQQRKSTGSYYTPQYIVDCIVQSTVGPSIDSIIKDTPDKGEQIEKILSLNILDPAMGSGHFLVGAVDYVAKKICEIEDEEINEQRLIDRKRDVARRCIYGVDVNPLAVDLAMVSLWLETLSSERPLSFFSAHLKCGNSLIGSKIETLFDKQTTLMESQKGRERFKKTIRDFIMFESLEDDSANAVKTKMEKYANIQSKGTIYYDLKFLLDCKTAESFGIKITAFGDYKAKIGENSLDFFIDDLLQKVKQLSDKYKFFHWELEFPDIFFEENGLKKQDPGFDIVVGNPPYIKIETVGSFEKKFLFKNYQTSRGRFDLYILFMEKGLELLKNNGYFSYIVPNKFAKTENGKIIRDYISNNCTLQDFIDFGPLKVFGNKTTYSSIIVIRKSKKIQAGNCRYIKIKKIIPALLVDVIEDQTKTNYDDDTLTVIQFKQDEIDSNPWTFQSDEINKIHKKLKTCSKTKLMDIVERMYEGFVAGDNDVFFLDNTKSRKYNIENELLKPVPKGKDVRRFSIKWKNRYAIFPYYNDNNKMIPISLDEFPNVKKYFEENKSRLKNRKSLEGTSKKWFEMIRPREYDWFEQDKIITPNLSTNSNFCVDFGDNDQQKHFFVDHDCYGIILKNKNREEYLVLLGILNSKLMEFFIKQNSPKYGGSYFKYHTQYLENIPIIEIKNRERNTLVEIVNKILKLKKNDNSKEIIILEQELDHLIYKLYGISEFEQEVVEKFLNESITK
jgi:hypothetical protein